MSELIAGEQIWKGEFVYHKDGKVYVNEQSKLRRPRAYPCCEAVRRVESTPGDASTLLGGVCSVHGISSVDTSRPLNGDDINKLTAKRYKVDDDECPHWLEVTAICILLWPVLLGLGAVWVEKTWTNYWRRK